MRGHRRISKPPATRRNKNDQGNCRRCHRGCCRSHRAIGKLVHGRSDRARRVAAQWRGDRHRADGHGVQVTLIQRREKISVKTSTYTWDKMNSYSYDQQPADLKISVTLRAPPDKVSDLYAKFGLLDTAVNQVVSPVVNQQVKVVFGRYTAVKAIQERGALNSSIKDAITDTLKY